ncbi:MAG: hypothetical protein J0I09_00160 [Sphingobacteriia bacterium]|nr:hypothetical protein [Sphingobacteriia bacterium]
MEIDINQKEISIGDKYQIFIDGSQTYSATRQLFQLLPEINLFSFESERPRMKINKLFSWPNAKYNITRWDNNILEFRTKSFWKYQYQCQCGTDFYEIYGHLGRKFSIFKNDIQIAWWDKKAVSWFAGDNYKIIAENNCDKDLVISFCIIIDNFYNDNHDGNMVNFDFGNLGFNLKKFDHDWQPKS